MTGKRLWWLVSVEVIVSNRSCRNHLLLDIDIESLIEAAPDSAEMTPFDDFCGEIGIERTQARSEHAAIGFGEKYGHLAAETGQAIAVHLGHLFNEPFALEAR